VHIHLPDACRWSTNPGLEFDLHVINIFLVPGRHFHQHSPNWFRSAASLYFKSSAAISIPLLVTGYPYVVLKVEVLHTALRESLSRDRVLNYRSLLFRSLHAALHHLRW